MDFYSYLFIGAILIIPFVKVVQFVINTKRRENPRTTSDYVKFVLKILTTLGLGLLFLRLYFDNLIDAFTYNK